MGPEATPIDDRPTDALGPPGALEDSPGPAEAASEAPGVEGPVSEESMAGLIDNFGGVVNWLGPTPEWAPDAWLFTAEETAALSAVLTRIANARAPVVTAMAAERSDEVAAVVQFGRYVRRNVKAIRPPGDLTDWTPEAEAAAAAAEAGEAVVIDADTGAIVVDPEDDLTRPYFDQGVDI